MVVTSVIDVDEALFRLPTVQIPVDVAYVPVEGVTETKFSLESKISVTVTPVALSGPLFVTVIVYVTVSPTLAVDLSDVFSTERLAIGVATKLKVAVQVLFEVIVTCPLALQSPDHPAKVDPAEAVAVAVTIVPELYVPAPVTVPEPLPAVLTVRV